MSPNPVDEALLGGVCLGERRAIAKAITLLESTRADHRARADALLDRFADSAHGGFHLLGAVAGHGDEPIRPQVAAGLQHMLQ